MDKAGCRVACMQLKNKQKKKEKEKKRTRWTQTENKKDRCSKKKEKKRKSFSPPRAWYTEATSMIEVSFDSLREYKWRHQSVFLVLSPDLNHSPLYG